MTLLQQYQAELAHERLGLRVAACLSETNDQLDHDIAERLRAARVRALAQRKLVAKPATASVLLSSGPAAVLGLTPPAWWVRMATAIPALALLIGLMTINNLESDHWAREVAEVDTALLVDELPPDAYTDPGFGEFLRVTLARSP